MDKVPLILYIIFHSWKARFWQVNIYKFYTILHWAFLISVQRLPPHSSHNSWKFGGNVMVTPWDHGTKYAVDIWHFYLCVVSLHTIKKKIQKSLIPPTSSAFTFSSPYHPALSLLPLLITFSVFSMPSSFPPSSSLSPTALLLADGKLSFLL